MQALLGALFVVAVIAALLAIPILLLRRAQLAIDWAMMLSPGWDPGG